MTAATPERAYVIENRYSVASKPQNRSLESAKKGFGG
jgi:hypothetical protein